MSPVLTGWLRRGKVQPATTAGLPKPAPARHTLQISFTALESPHMPAREQRELELKATKEEREQLQLQVGMRVQVKARV